MKRTVRNFGLILSLCVPLLAMGQDQMQANTELATQVSKNVEQTIKDNEKNWSLKQKHLLGPVTWQRWRSGAQELDLRIFVYDSEKEASTRLVNHGAFSVAFSQPLKGFGGDEARFIDYPYFTWVGVRKGSVVVVVQGPGKDMALTKRFVKHALAQLEKN